MDDPRLKDGMQTHWPEGVVEEIVSSFIIRHKVKTIVTFDPCGVSSHPNHMAVCAGVRRVVGVTRLELKSTSILQKFMGPLEACAYYLLKVSCKYWFIIRFLSSVLHLLTLIRAIFSAGAFSVKSGKKEISCVHKSRSLASVEGYVFPFEPIHLVSPFVYYIF